MNYQTLRYDVADRILTLTLHRPDRMNAFTGVMADELIAAFDRADADDAVKVVIVTGAGRAFCAGADLTVLERDGTKLVAAGKSVALTIRQAPKPVIAAVNGAAAGGGANLALACDYRIAADTASIGQVFPRLGLGQDWGGSFFLPRLVPPSTALELVWSARMVAAAEARELGLFDRVVPADRLLLEAHALAAAWAQHPPLALRRVKEGIYRSDGHTLKEMLDWEIVQQNELFATAEARARIGQSASARSR